VSGLARWLRWYWPTVVAYALVTIGAGVAGVLSLYWVFVTGGGVVMGHTMGHLFPQEPAKHPAQAVACAVAFMGWLVALWVFR
jgi:hypothetical protein